MLPYHYNSVCMCHYWSMVYCHCSLFLVTGSHQLNCCMLLNTLQMSPRLPMTLQLQITAG